MTLHIDFWKIEKLIPYAKNSRTHSQEQVSKIAESIKTYGFTNPILVDEDAGILAGHGRLAAAKLLKLDEVPVIILTGLTETQKRAYVIADNKLAADAGWDDAILAEELAYLMEKNALDLAGFTDYEAQKHFEKLDAAEASAETEEDGTNDSKELTEDTDNLADDLQEIITTKSGQIWLLGEHKLLCGDATSPADLRLLMQDELADLALTDPPYGVDYIGKTKEALTISNENLDKKEFAKFLKNAFANLYKFTKDTAPAFIWLPDRRLAEFAESLQQAKYITLQMLIWQKHTFAFGRGDYHFQHEPCLFCVKADDFTTPLEESNSVYFYDKPSSSTLHPTIKPTDLFAEQITQLTQSGQIVLDTFGGSGTTLLACETLGRQARIVEIDPHYCDVIVNRWQAQTGFDAIDLKTGKTFNEIKRGIK